MDSKTFTFNITDDLYKDIAIEAIKHEKTTKEEILYAIAFYLKETLRREYLDRVDTQNPDERDSVKHINNLYQIDKKYEKYLGK